MGYTPLPGAQLRYFVMLDQQIIALLGFGAAAWQAAPRDQYIGWSHTFRKRLLPLVVNNARFLILPWIQVNNLASKILSMAAKQVPEDWQKQY
ncbi:MAG: Druantia anti-phage system protein DruA, partial [Syntrophales bacterium]